MTNYDDVMVFLAVARTGTLLAASETLRQDPATISRRIKRLEQALGTILFAKSPRGYQLTADGLNLKWRAEAAESILAGIETEMGQRAKTLSGRMRIGAPEGCATFLLSDIVAEISAQNPELAVDVVVSSRDFDLLNREVDLSISVSPPTAKAVASTVLANYELHFACSRGFADHNGQSFRPQDVPQIAYISEMLVDDGLAIPKELESRTTMLRSNSVNVQWEWIRGGHGIGLVHDFILRNAADMVRLFPERAIQRRYHLNVRREELDHFRIKTMVGALQKGFAARLGAVTS